MIVYTQSNTQTKIQHYVVCTKQSALFLGQSLRRVIMICFSYVNNNILEFLIKNNYVFTNPAAEDKKYYMQFLLNKVVANYLDHYNSLCSSVKKSLALDDSLAKPILVKRTFYPRYYASVNQFLALTNGLSTFVKKPLDPLPEGIVPVYPNELQDKIDLEYFEKLSKGCDYLREDHIESCEISQTDKDFINRVLADRSEDKAILWVGFSQTKEDEGGNIDSNSEKYRKSLFWSGEDYAGKDRPQDKNTMRMCFCQSENLLEEFPTLENFFDYIIIGYATHEYVHHSTWLSFGKMLKEGGRIVYPAKGEVLAPHFVFRNGLLRDNDQTYTYNLYSCDAKNTQEDVVNEINDLASFYDKNLCEIPNCKFYWHKKVKK